jgi:cysteine-rich repeat protein
MGRTLCLVFSLALGCGGGGTDCEAGAIESCSCAGGATGTRVCAAGGTFGTCSCGTTDGGAPDGEISVCDDPSRFCAAPPPPECVDATTLRTVLATCVDDECLYEPTETPCPFACEAGACVGPDDVCGSVGLVIDASASSLEVDTRDMAADMNSECEGETTIGNDAYVAIDALAGEHWHFHVRSDPDSGVERAPAIQLFTAACDVRDCTNVSNACAGPGEEHLSFIAPSAGRYYLAIDDTLAGGGTYILDAIRSVCGDNIRAHGEACDDANVIDGDGCTSDCLVELDDESPREYEPNDSIPEANYLVLGEDAELTVEGNIGGVGACTYADIFAIDVPADGDLEVDAREPGGGACASPALTAGYDLVLTDAAGRVIAGGISDETGCAIVRSTNLPAGTYYLWVDPPVEADIPSAYHLRTRVLP